jgi:hypothetical protein
MNREMRLAATAFHYVVEDPGFESCCQPALHLQRKRLERVGRSRHRRCDPGRAHRLLHPRFVESLPFRGLSFQITLSTASTRETGD